MTTGRGRLAIQQHTVDIAPQGLAGRMAVGSKPVPFYGHHEDPLAIRPELLEEAKAFLEEYEEDFIELARL